MPPAVLTAWSSDRISPLLPPDIREGNLELDLGPNGGKRGDGRATAKVIACAVHKSTNVSRNSPLIVGSRKQGNKDWIVEDCMVVTKDIRWARARVDGCGRAFQVVWRREQKQVTGERGRGSYL